MGRNRRELTVALAAVVVSALVPVTAAAATPPGVAALAADEPITAASQLAGAATSVGVADVGQPLADRLLVTFAAATDPGRAGAVLAAAGVVGALVEGFTVAVADVDPASAADAVTRLAAAPEVVDVELDRQVAFRPAAVPDPLRQAQWWWHNSGQIVEGTSGASQSGLRGIDIGAEEAWTVTQGRPEVVVAIVDTGLDVSHPDLAPNLWRNPDVGAFGCVGDLHGCNFTRPGPSGQVYAGPGEDQHGTHLAGIVAAAEDQQGTVGVAPRVQVMSVKFMRRDVGLVGDALKAIQYAARAGADVINASWGLPGSPADYPALDLAIREARVPVVVAAGNNRGDLDVTPYFPATSDAPNVIVVTAVDNRGVVAEFANTSPRIVDVAAPGVRVLSTFPDASYGLLDGTSQAAPAVSGLVALAVAETGITDGATIAAAVRRGARPLGTATDRTHPSGASAAGLASAPGTLQALGVRLGACLGEVPPAPFVDLLRTDVHATNVDCIVDLGLASGYPDATFRPAAAVTRGQVATFLAGVVETVAPLPQPEVARFVDLATSVHRPAIEGLAQLGMVSGFEDGSYRPDVPVSRAQFASLLVRTYETLVEGSVRPVGGRFSDVAGSTHERNIRVAAYLGFVRGVGGDRFAPDDGVNRAQLASLLRSALDKLVNDRVSDGTGPDSGSPAADPDAADPDAADPDAADPDAADPDAPDPDAPGPDAPDTVADPPDPDVGDPGIGPPPAT